jgi:hypothetical protein
MVRIMATSPLGLLRRILRAHRHLAPEMRALGDQYVTCVLFNPSGSGIALASNVRQYCRLQHRI